MARKQKHAVLATAPQPPGMPIAFEKSEVNLKERRKIYGKPERLEPAWQLPDG
jgi:hypothetical protein